ncbi:hypothetical protein BJF85_02830 [Saccharomonospora sp. CUA-673]|uniref:hypothetical protein n=1 Tax=Saccharomonospora sp. CUA-673 TaxID=1904969 RepID=UPI000959E51A|nr:hypothetical protein [Saccharomonospora sp. CUA-673]OLT43053.1 hypothetical protein BJF85_02830 [Saccharomonospora sp. CUA-673]
MSNRDVPLDRLAGELSMTPAALAEQYADRLRVPRQVAEMVRSLVFAERAAEAERVATAEAQAAAERQRERDRARVLGRGRQLEENVQNAKEQYALALRMRDDRAPSTDGPSEETAAYWVEYWSAEYDRAKAELDAFVAEHPAAVEGVAA